MQGQHQEGSPTTGIHDDGHKAGVDSTEGAVPGDARHADVIVALVVLHCLAEDVPEFALSYHPPHRVCTGMRKEKGVTLQGKDVLIVQEVPG